MHAIIFITPYHIIIQQNNSSKVVFVTIVTITHTSQHNILYINHSSNYEKSTAQSLTTIYFVMKPYNTVYYCKAEVLVCGNIASLEGVWSIQ